MKLFRSMKEDSNGLPAVGPTGRTLGVRPGNSPMPDVFAVNPSDKVLPGKGGMSVAPDDPGHLLKHRRPPSLGGIGPDPVWYIETDDLGAELQIRQDSPKHGIIEPVRPMTLQEYEHALATTQAHWTLYCR